MKFKDLLQEKRVIIFDGAMGTSLQPYLSGGIPPEKLNLTSPQRVKEVHLSYLKEGVDVIETNTFGGNRIKLEKYGLSPYLKDINYRAVKIAKEVAPSKLVGASIGPLGELIEPWGNITSQQALQAFREQIEVVAEAGADLIVIETMMYIKEAKIAAAAAKQVCDLPVVCQLTFGKQAKTLTGTDPRTVVLTMQAMDVDALGANCSIGPEEMFQVVKIMSSCASKPLIFQPNAGNPHLENGKTVFPVGPEEYSQWMSKFVEEGVRIVGGCCGTTPSHIAAMIRKVKGLSSPPRKLTPVEGISSRTKSYLWGKKIYPLVGIKFTQEYLVKKENWEKVVEMTEKAREAGCSFLNLNVRDKSEEFGASSFINFIQQNTDLAITLDMDPFFLKEGLVEELEGKSVVFVFLQEDESVRIARRWGVAVGFNIYADKWTKFEDELNLIFHQWDQVNLNLSEKILRIILPSSEQLSSIFIEEGLRKIQNLLASTQVRVILDLSNIDFSKDSSLGKFLKKSVLNKTRSYAIDGIILKPWEIDIVFHL